jgi:hypothetical protein
MHMPHSLRLKVVMEGLWWTPLDTKRVKNPPWFESDDRNREHCDCATNMPPV